MKETNEILLDIAGSLREMQRDIVDIKKKAEEHFAELGKNKGKYLYVADADVTAIEDILNKQSITSNQFVKVRAPIGSSTLYEYTLNIDDDRFNNIIADIRNLDLPVAWSWEKPGVIITL